MNTGHGHVYKREDGMKARCGGPACCAECARDLARQQAERRKRNTQNLQGRGEPAAVSAGDEPPGK